MPRLMPHKQYALNANTVSVSGQRVFVSALENTLKFQTKYFTQQKKDIVRSIIQKKARQKMSKISKELIESFRKIVLPFVSSQLYRANFEGQGAIDRAEFEQDCNEILDLAISALNPSLRQTRRTTMELIVKIPDEDYKYICKIANDLEGRAVLPTDWKAIANGTPYNPSGDTISRSALKKEVVGMMINKADDLEEVEFEINAVLASVCEAIDNAQAVEYTFEEAFQKTVCDNKSYCPSRQKGDCENCDYRKFSETCVDAVVEVMNEYGITSAEELMQKLKGGAK